MKKIIFILGGLLLIFATAFNFKVSLNSNKLLSASILSIQNSAYAIILPKIRTTGQVVKLVLILTSSYETEKKKIYGGL